jgi:hypothetical protein
MVVQGIPGGRSLHEAADSPVYAAIDFHWQSTANGEAAACFVPTPRFSR